MHEPAGTEPGRKTAGTVVILAGDTIGAIARTSPETTAPTRLTQAGIEFRQPGELCVAGDQMLRKQRPLVGPTHRTLRAVAQSRAALGVTCVRRTEA
jgi:hypothetical protein